MGTQTTALTFVRIGLLALAACGNDVALGGPNTLVRVEPELPGANCVTGGVKILTGLDHDGDTYLDDDEVTSTQYVCNGVPDVQCDGGNVLTGTITVTSTSDFDQLSGVNCIDGDLLIAGTTVEQLPKVGDLRIVTGDIVVTGNPKLKSTSGLQGVRDMGGTYLIQGNDALTDLTGLGSLERVFALSIVGNNALPDLHGLEGLANVHAALTIANNIALHDLGGLEQLVTIDQPLAIRSNPALVSVDALSGLRSARSIEISGNSALPDITFASLEKVDFRSLYNANAALRTISLPVLATTGDFFQIDSNGALASFDVPELITAGGFLIDNDNSFTAFTAPKLVYVTKQLDFNTMPLLSTIDAPVLTSVGGELVIMTAPALASFHLGQLSTIGGQFWLSGTNTLQDFRGLESLYQVSDNMTVTNNAALRSFAGLDGLTIIGADLTISLNPLLPVATSHSFAAGVTVHGRTQISQ